MFELCALDRNLSVALTGNVTFEWLKERLISGNDPDLEGSCAGLVRNRLLVGAQLLTRRPVHPLKYSPATQVIHEFTTVIWRAEHDHAAEIHFRHGLANVPDDNAAQRVCYEADGLRVSLYAFPNSGQYVISRQDFDRVFRGGISDMASDIVHRTPRHQ